MEDAHSYTPVKRLLLALLVAVLLLIPLVVFISPTRWFVATPAPVNSASEDANRFKLAEARFAQAMTRLAAHDWAGCRQAYLSVPAALRYQQDSSTMIDPRTGTAAPQWFAQRQDRLATAMLAQVEPLLQQVLAGTITLQTAIDNIYSFPNDQAFLAVRQHFDNRRLALAPQAVARARKTLRITLLNASPQYTPALQAALRSRWPADLPYELTFDPPWGPADGEATWKAFNLEVHTHTAEVSVGQPDSALDGLPESMQVTDELALVWRTPVTGALPSNWDELPTITIALPVPPEVINEPDQRRKRRALAQQQGQAMGRLWQQALDQVAAIPPFELFSQVDLTQPLVDSAGKVNAKQAQALALREPRRFEEELAAVRTRKDTSALGQLAGLIIRKQLQDFAPWVADTIPALDRAGQRQVMQELAAAPAFGSHAPLLVLIHQLNDHSSREALRVFLRDTPTDAQLNAVTGWLQDGEGADRDELAAFFLRNVDAHWLPELASWLYSPQPALAARAMTVLRQRAPALLEQTLITQYEQFPDKTRLGLMEAFTYDPVAHGPAGAAMLQRAVRQTANAALRQAAVEAWARSTATAAGWEAGQALLANPPAEVELANLRVALIRQARAVAPDPAGFLLGEITAAERLRTLKPAPEPAVLLAGARSRDLALQALFTLPAPPAALAQLVTLMGVQADDTGLANALLAGLAQAAHAPTWDWDLEAARTLLTRATRSASAEGRKLAYLLMGDAQRAGHPAYRQLLEDAAASEADPDLRDQIKRQLAP